MIVLALVCAALPLLWMTALKRPDRDLVRDRAVQLCCWGLALWLLTIEPFLAIGGMSVLLRWFDHETYTTREYQPVVWCWLAAVGLWFGARAVPVDVRPWIAGVWVTWGLVQGALSIGQWAILRNHWSGWGSGWAIEPIHLYAGTFGQRSMTGAYVGLVFPLAFLLPSPASWGVASGLLLAICSWLGFLAMLVAGVVLQPRLAVPLSLLGLGLAVFVGWEWRAKHSVAGRATWLDRYTTRAGSLDSVFLRVRHWRRMWWVWRQWPVWVTGRGVGRGWRDAARVQAGRDPDLARLPRVQAGHAHNDWIEVAYEHGLLGVAAMILLAFRVGAGVHWADPWTASAIAGAVLAAGTFSVRLASLAAPWWIVLAWVAP